MGKKITAPSYAVPFMMADLAFASWETILRRAALMAQGTCTQTEYARMVSEKVAAAQLSALALAKPWISVEPAAVLAPWHRRATVNARRLRRR
jgi:hypothetical protein